MRLEHLDNLVRQEIIKTWLGLPLKILLATDSLKCSKPAVKELVRRPWPSGTEGRVVSVRHTVPPPTDPARLVDPYHVKVVEEVWKRISHEVASVADKSPVLTLCVSTHVLEGSPKKLIIEEAEQWGSRSNYRRVKRDTARLSACFSIRSPRQ